MFSTRKTLMALTAMVAVTGVSFGAENARSFRFEIKAQTLAQALRSFGRVAGQEIVFSDDVVKGGRTVSLEGEFTADAALSRLLEGTGFVAKRASSGAIRVVREAELSSGAGSPANQMRVAAAGTDASGDPQSAGSSTQAAEVVVRDRKDVVPFEKSMDLRRTEDDALPFQVFTEKDIQMSAAMSLEEFLNKELPQNFSEWSPDQEAGGGAAFITPSKVNLRGWGESETLFLLNGEPMPLDYGLSSSANTPQQPNLSLIPLDSIERVEILSSAAGAIYGVGATGGVINIITRQDYASRPGGRVSVRYSSPMDTYVPRRNFDLSYSQPLNWWGLGLSVGASYGDSVPVPVRYRQESTVIRWRQRALDAGSLPLTGLLVGATPNVMTSSAASGNILPGFAGRTTSVPAGATGGTPLSAYQPGYNIGLVEGNAGENLWATQSTLGAPTDNTRFSLGLTKKFNERWSASLDVSHSTLNREGVNYGLGGAGGSFFVTMAANNPNNPFNKAVTVYLFDPYISSALDNRADSTSETSRVNLSLRGRIAEWYGAFSAGATDNEGRQNRYEISGFVSRPGATTTYATLQQAINAGIYNPLVDMRVAMPAAPAFYQSYTYRDGEFKAATRNYVSTFRASGPLARVLGRTVPLTAGLDWRRTHRHQYGTELPVINVNTGEVTLNAASADRNPAGNNNVFDRYGIYAETSLPLITPAQNVPLLKNLDLDLAGRLSWLARDTFRSQSVLQQNSQGILEKPVRYTTRTEDISYALRYALGGPKWLEGITLRGSPPRTARKMPTPDQTTPLENPPAATIPSNPGSSSAVFLVDTARGGQPIGTLQANQYINGGNPDLRPESTKTTSFGLIIAPPWMNGMRLSLDYNASDRKDAIQTLTAQEAINLEFEVPGLITRGEPDGDPSGLGPIQFIDFRTTNLRRIQQKSVDLSARYSIENVGAGALELSAMATRQLTFKVQTSNTGEPVEQVRNPAATLSSQQIAWRGNTQVRWVGSQWSVGWRTYYKDYVLLQPSFYAFQGGDRAPRAFDHDVSVSYVAPSMPTARGVAGLLSGTTVVLNITNVFDRTPRFWAPATDRGIAPYDTIGGREITLNFSKGFSLQ